MKFTVQARKLANADVQFLSLVERGANRAPFKIQKTEKPMFNLDRSLTRIMKGDDKPGIVGYVIAKEDNVPDIEKALKAAGVDTASVVADGDVLVLKQGNADLKSSSNITVKLAPDFMVVCKGFDSASSFAEVLKSQGFLPSPAVAAEALYGAVRDALASEDSVSKIDEAVDDFHAYVTSIAKSIPQPAFKAFEAFRAAKYELVRKEMAKPGDVPQDKWDEMDNSERMAACKAYKDEQDRLAAKKAEDDAAAAKKAEDEAKAKAAKGDEDEKKDPPADPAKPAPALDAKAISEAVTAAVKAATDPLAKQVQSAVDSAKKTQDSLVALTTQVAAVQKDAAAAKELAAKAEATLKGTVLSGGEGGDPEDKPVRKADGEIGAFDTAFNKNVRKRDRALEVQRHQRIM